MYYPSCNSENQLEVQCKRVKEEEKEAFVLIVLFQAIELIIFGVIYVCCFFSGVLLKDQRDPDALYVRGLSLYYQDNMDKAQQHFQQVLKFAPDHAKARQAFKVIM